VLFIIILRVLPEGVKCRSDKNKELKQKERMASQAPGGEQRKTNTPAQSCTSDK